MPKNKRGKLEDQAPPEPMTCIYCPTTIGGYPALEQHVVVAHGVSRHRLHCSLSPLCEGLEFDSLQKRRAHNRKLHGER